MKRKVAEWRKGKEEEGEKGVRGGSEYEGERKVYQRRNKRNRRGKKKIYIVKIKGQR